MAFFIKIQIPPPKKKKRKKKTIKPPKKMVGVRPNGHRKSTDLDELSNFVNWSNFWRGLFFLQKCRSKSKIHDFVPKSIGCSDEAESSPKRHFR